MAILTAKQHFSLLKYAELQFRLAISVSVACNSDEQALGAPDFSFGNVFVAAEEIELSPEQAKEAAAVLEHTTTNTLALQIVQAMKDVFGKDHVGYHPNASTNSAFHIARLIRNAYAHQPFWPHWSIEPKYANRVYKVAAIARIDTTGLDGKPVRWQDYGGMLALFRLSQFVRSLIVPSKAESGTAA